MIEASLRDSTLWRRPGFDQIPPTLERLLAGRTIGDPINHPLLRERFDRVAFVYLDAFGWELFERQLDHPLVRRALSHGVVMEMRSQFPSTTSAHMTTIHSGLPVAEHGIYEWHVFEPSLNRLIAPLPYCFAGDSEPNTLDGTLAPECVYPRGWLYPSLSAAGVRSFVSQSDSFAHGPPNRVLLEGAKIVPFAAPRAGIAAAAAALQEAERCYSHVYLEHVDTAMHEVGPAGEQVDRAFAEVLTAVWEAEFPRGTLVLLAADHGMAPVTPEQTVYINLIWPEVIEHLKVGADGKPLAPAGSCRALFLHVREGHVDEVCARLALRLEGVADVVSSATLVASGVFESPSDELQARLGEVAVLPRYGEAVYWYEEGRFVQNLHGQHGGLSAEEMVVPLIGWVAD